jgi:hypothetical protein
MNDKLTNIGGRLVDNLIGATGLSGKLKRLQSLLGGNADKRGSSPNVQTISFSGDKFGQDPRIKIKIPESYLGGPARHIRNTSDGGIVFPYTPQIVVQTRANYNNLNPTHSNYTYYAYQNSALDAISIVGTFTAQNPDDAKYMLGDLPDHEDEWLGFRPSTPDFLPVIGPSKNHKNIFYCFGHHHLGWTLGPISGKIIAGMITGENTNLDLKPYSSLRFS